VATLRILEVFLSGANIELQAIIKLR
ncbi:MAG: hypothetical protein RLZZ115_3531, partial [Cyanobacteriota bacterium]